MNVNPAVLWGDQCFPWGMYVCVCGGGGGGGVGGGMLHKEPKLALQKAGEDEPDRSNLSSKTNSHPFTSFSLCHKNCMP